MGIYKIKYKDNNFNKKDVAKVLVCLNGKNIFIAHTVSENREPNFL